MSGQSTAGNSEEECCDECGRDTSLKAYHGNKLCIVCWDAAKRGVQ